MIGTTPILLLSKMPSTRNGHAQETPTKEHKDLKPLEGDDDSLASEEETSSCELWSGRCATPLSFFGVAADDEEEAERKKMRCLDDMACLEQQFVDLKEL